jgi:DNA-binding CsgD family transcriptional regulator
VSEELLRSLFGLSPAEARVVVALSTGLTPREVAAHLDIALNTTRVHLRHIFEKTGTGRQAELLQLVMRTAAVS